MERVNNIETGGGGVRCRGNRSKCENRVGHYIDYMSTNPGLELLPRCRGEGEEAYRRGTIIFRKARKKFIFYTYTCLYREHNGVKKQSRGHCLDSLSSIRHIKHVCWIIITQGKDTLYSRFRRAHTIAKSTSVFGECHFLNMA